MAEECEKHRKGMSCLRPAGHVQHEGTPHRDLYGNEWTDPQIKFTATLTREMTKQIEWEVDSAEFAEWAEGKEPTPALIKEFMRAHRDAAEIEDSMWALAKDADDYISPFVEIVRVDLHG